MTTQKELEFLKWCKVQGIDAVASNNIRTYLKNDHNSHEMASILKGLQDSGRRAGVKHQSVSYHTREAQSPEARHPRILKGEEYMLKNADQEPTSRQVADNCSTLQDLKAAVHRFDGCLLKKTASNTVFADGNPSAQVMLIGEAPGANEDLQGIPFCGESGKLLDKVLKSIGLVRESSVYITNSIFWRPPGNRKPTDDEIKCCLPFVEKHIALIKPKLIILAGSVALQALFGNTGSISKQRQRILSYKNEYLDAPIAATAIFHPSYLLRQPSQKKLAWYDMLFIKDFLMKHD